MVSLAALLIFFCLFIYFRLFRRAPRQGTREVVALWRARSFTPFTDRAQIAQLVDKVPVDLQASLTEPQHKALRETVTELLDIYRTGNYEQFLGYVQRRKGALSPDGSRRLNSMPFLKTSLDKAAQEVGQEIPYMKDAFRQWRWPPSTDAERLKAWWTIRYYKNGVWKDMDTRDAKMTIFEHEAASLPTKYVFSQMSKFSSEVGGQALGSTWRFFGFPMTAKQGKHKYALQELRS